MDGTCKKMIQSLAVVLLAGSLVSCGVKGQEENQQKHIQEKTVIRIAWWGGQGRHQYTQELLDVYTELHPEVEFQTYPSEWDDYFDKLSIQAASGAMPDIVQMDYQYITTYTCNGSLTDLQEYIDKQIIETADIDEKILETGIVDGRMSGMPLATSMLCVGYNKELLQQAEVEMPDQYWTWDDLWDAARRVTAFTGEPSVVTASGVTTDCNILQYWVRQHGSDLFHDSGTSLGFEDTKIVADFFQMWKDMMDEGLTPNPDEMAQIVSKGQDAGPVVTGQAAFIFEWNNYAVKMADINNNIKITTPPSDKKTNRKELWVKPGMFFSIAETSSVKDECAEFINWFVNSQKANEIIMAERSTPVSEKIRTYMLESKIMSAQQEEMFRYEEEALPLCNETPDPEPIGIVAVNEVFNDLGNNVFYGKMGAQEAAELFCQRANEILKQSK